VGCRFWWCFMVFPKKNPKKVSWRSLLKSLLKSLKIHVFLRTPKRVLKFVVAIPESQNR
jgi:hypothetical protein